jgi:hypothetical protein
MLVTATTAATNISPYNMDQVTSEEEFADVHDGPIINGFGAACMRDAGCVLGFATQWPILDPSA